MRGDGSQQAAVVLDRQAAVFLELVDAAARDFELVFHHRQASREQLVVADGVALMPEVLIELDEPRHVPRRVRRLFLLVQLGQAFDLQRGGVPGYVLDHRRDQQLLHRQPVDDILLGIDRYRIAALGAVQEAAARQLEQGLANRRAGDAVFVGKVDFHQPLARLKLA
ncbi:MAG: hypothetical protein WDM85_07085 [Caulobacteraceae bacterium]